MSDRRDAAAYVLSASGGLLDRFVADFTAEDWLHRACAKANCAAWVVGHLTLSERSALGRLGVAGLPALPDGFERRFARSEEASGAQDFGDTQILRSIFKSHRDLLVATAQSLPLEQFDAPVEARHPMFKTVGQMLEFMAVHTSMHAGQISTIRRSLGKPPLM